MPEEQSAIMLIVPVGATQVIAAFRTFKFLSLFHILSGQLGKHPRFSANSPLACLAFSFMNFIIDSAIATPSLLLDPEDYFS